MSEPIDLAHLRQWVGRSVVDQDVISLRHAQLMAATVGIDAQALALGAALPPLWHWLYFLEGKPAAQLGADGHPARGGFLPPVPLANRMWAGGRVSFMHPIALGARAEKRSTVLAVDHKQGRSGDLVFVTVGHELLVGGQVCLAEQHDIVYKAPSPAAPVATAPEPAQVSTHQHHFVPDATMLFRYSALTFNGHRIHYDLDYCRQQEGYDNLVIHGPLNATMMAAFAQQLVGDPSGKPMLTFTYKGLRPAILGQTLTVHATVSGGAVQLGVALANGALAMQASAQF
jgi:3-methylfumaryl-CoA hydratase